MLNSLRVPGLSTLASLNSSSSSVDDARSTENVGPVVAVHHGGTVAGGTVAGGGDGGDGAVDGRRAPRPSPLALACEEELEAHNSPSSS